MERQFALLGGFTRGMIMVLFGLGVSGTAWADREIPFLQTSYSFDAPVSFIAANVSVFNPTAQPITVRVQSNLNYSTAPGTRFTDSGDTTLAIPAGGVQIYPLGNTRALAGGGSYIPMHFSGKIVVIGAVGHVVASGHLLVTDVDYVGAKRFSNLTFKIHPGDAF